MMRKLKLRLGGERNEPRRDGDAGICRRWEDSANCCRRQVWWPMVGRAVRFAMNVFGRGQRRSGSGQLHVVDRSNKVLFVFVMEKRPLSVALGRHTRKKFRDGSKNFYSSRKQNESP